MKEYPHLTAALAIEGAVMQADTEGFLTLQPEQADALESLHAAADTRIEEAQAKLIEANANYAALQTKFDALTVSSAADAETIASLKASIETLRQQLSDANGSVSSLKQRIADLNATISAINDAQGAQPKTGETPANNGTSAPAKPRLVTASTYDPTLSAEENYNRRQAAIARLQKQANH